METEQVPTYVLKNEFIPTPEFYSQILDSLQDYSIFTTDKELRINSWSAGSAKIFGYTTDEVMGKHCEIIFTDEDKKNDITKIKIETALKEGRVADSRWHVCKDGSQFYAYGLIFPLTDKAGELLGFVKILRDLTERKKSEEAIQKYIKELEEINTHKENILAILSHDLRSPLSTIVGIANYLKSDIDHMTHNEVKHMVDILNNASIDELNMLDYLLEWARIKFASDIFSPTKIDLGKYVRRVFDTLFESAASKTIHLQNEIKEKITVFADEKMLFSILQNLVSNAIKYSHQGGTVSISATINDNKAMVQVKDTGIGMSKERQEKLFTPQVKTLSKARDEDRGAGIGILLVKGFLERNGGKIWVESVKGEGSTFYFTLPINESSAKAVRAGKMEFDEGV
jgi:PAS domain S-box-containing protein